MGKMHADEVDIDSSLVARLTSRAVSAVGGLTSLAGPICRDGQRDLSARG